MSYLTWIVLDRSKTKTMQNHLGGYHFITLIEFTE